MKSLVSLDDRYVGIVWPSAARMLLIRLARRRDRRGSVVARVKGEYRRVDQAGGHEVRRRASTADRNGGREASVVAAEHGPGAVRAERIAHDVNAIRIGVKRVDRPIDHGHDLARHGCRAPATRRLRARR